MFGRMMNNYYYGKSGKGDFRKEDLPQNRRQLFFDTLKTRLSGLCRINLIYMLIFLPVMITLMIGFINILSGSSNLLLISDSENYAAYTETMTKNGGEVQFSEEQYNEVKNGLAEGRFTFADLYDGLTDSTITSMCLWLIPFITITGPFTAGLSYVTRNWARDEHAFIWTDFKDAVKANWKQSLVLSFITSLMPLAVYVGWDFYGKMVSEHWYMVIPQVLVVLVALIWSVSITYMHPLAVTYELKMTDLIKNGLLLGVARLPLSVAIRLLHCVPVLIGAAIVFLDPMIGMLVLFGYYVLIGFALSRFVTASYTNAVFDRFINSRIDGAKVNQGLREPDEDEDEDEESEKE